MAETSSTEYERERRAKLLRLRELGVDPYGQATTSIQALADVRGLYKEEMAHDGGPVVTVAGRVMLSRSFGKLTFITLRDDSGDLQVAIDKKRVSEVDWKIGELVDLGDLLVVTGKLGRTNKGEITIWTEHLAMAAKALLPPPGKHEGLADVELRYRQRYVDLWSNPEVMRLAKLRIGIVEEIRKYLRGQGYLEVETPMMQIMAGGAAARPFVTHHQALDIPLYLRIAPELYLKRLLVGGFTRVFEMNRNFRNEGISPRHNPEFTMLEAYEAFGSWQTMADLVEGMVCHVAQTVIGSLTIEHKDDTGAVTRTIHLSRPWRRARLTELVEEQLGWRFDKQPLATQSEGVRRRICTRLAERAGHAAPTPEHEADRLAALSPAEQLVEVYEKLIEPTLIDPCFVTHVPSVAIPLARENRDDPFFADVYELAVNGVELSPGYTELNDPEVQARHFAHQVGDEAEKQKTDDDFLAALKYGMPPAGGMGLGIDRLLMMLTGAQSIRDVILFPLMKPHAAAAPEGEKP